MANINPPIPELGGSTKNEDPKIQTALEIIRDQINGLLDNSNIKPAAGIEGSKLAAGGITTTQLANLAVTTDKLVNDAVDSTKLSDSASNDALRAVTTNHIKDAAVTNAKLSGSISNDADRSVDTNNIKVDAVTQPKIADNAVGAAQAKVRVLWDSQISSTSGEQTVASIFVQPGRYMVYGKTAQAGGTWKIDKDSTGTATFSEGTGSISRSSFSDYWQLVEVTSGTNLRLRSNDTGSRAGWLYIIGIEN